MIILGVIKAMGKNAYMGLDNRLYNFRTEKPSVRSNIREGEICRPKNEKPCHSLAIPVRTT